MEQVQQLEQPLTKRIPVFWQWIILFQWLINNCLIGPWTMSVPAECYLRISWRFLMQSFFLIPFIMYEKRTGSVKVKQQYQLKNIFDYDNFKQIYLNACGTSLWFILIVYGGNFVNIQNSIQLASLSNFVLSMQRRFNGDLNHSIETGGQILCVLGILLIMVDGFFFDVSDARPSAFKYGDTGWLYKSGYERIFLGDIPCFLASVALVHFDNKTINVKDNYPPLLFMFIKSTLCCINVIMISYFLHGTELYDDTNGRGFQGLFSSDNFPSFFCISLFLVLGSFLSVMIIAKLFDPVYPAMVSCYETVIMCLILDALGAHQFANSYSIMGSLLIIPGLYTIIIGQKLLESQ